MNVRAYYNDVDPAACAVLRELVASGLIPPGDVDDRSIKDVSPGDLAGYVQCHFFAGMGGWPFAARLARRPDSWPFWSASCPCQGESVAGKKLGADDPRHLWPDLYRLITACRPAVIVGEQVARAVGTHWLDRVCSDLDDAGYASRAVDLTAQAVDAPHQRQRLYWLAMADANGLAGQQDAGSPSRDEEAHRRARRHICEQDGDNLLAGDDEGRQRPMADANSRRRDGRQEDEIGRAQQPSAQRPNGSFYSDAEWIVCADEKTRRAKPGVRMLVDGLAGRTDLWRLAGNGLVLGLAAEVIAAIDG